MNLNQIIIEGIHFDINADHKSLVLSKCEKLLNHDCNIISLRIELIKDLHSASHFKEYIAKGHMQIKGKTITASSKSEQMYKSIDLLVNKLDRSLRRRSRIQKFKRHLNVFK
jgi:putative sigma-54 modulation protein